MKEKKPFQFISIKQQVKKTKAEFVLNYSKLKTIQMLFLILSMIMLVL